MKYLRGLSFALAVMILLTTLFSVFALAEGDEGVKDNPGIISGNAVVAYSLDDKQFLYTYRLDERVAPVVATKLMACMVVSDLLAEKKITADKVQVTVTTTALSNSGDIADMRVPMMGFKVGDVYTARDLLSATLVACANDAVASLADHFGQAFLGGNITDFIARMNKKAEEIGLKNTHFENATGLDSPNQYSTPREVALIAAAFYGYNDLVTLSNVDSFIFNGRTTVRSKNFLKNGYYVKGYTHKQAIGLIGGQLDRNGNYCLITASQKDGRTYIFVVMCASGMIVERDEENDVSYYSFGFGNAYDDMHKLIDWTRSSFELLSIATKNTIIGELRVELGSSSDHVMVVPAENVEKLVINAAGGKLESVLTYDESVVYKKDYNGTLCDTVQAPISQGQRVGRITYYYNGNELASVDAVVKDSIETDTVKIFLAKVEAFLFGKAMKTILYILVGIIVLYVLAAIATFIIGLFNKDEKKKQKKKSLTKKQQKENPPQKPTRDDRGDTKLH